MSELVIIPAIDLKDGKCVRLRQGKAEDKTVYSDDPVAMARQWEEQGARFLHVVDLDGAFQGHPVHEEIVIEIARAISIPVEIGGGIRTNEQIRRYLKGGLARAILGTRACESPNDLEVLARDFGEGLAVGIDAREGRVQISGWTETTEIDSVELATRVDEMGVKTIIYTDTATDGMLRGPNVPVMGEVCSAVSCSVVASGGITTTDDVVKLKALEAQNLVGAIVGKALYDGETTLRELQEAGG